MRERAATSFRSTFLLWVVVAVAVVGLSLLLFCLRSNWSRSFNLRQWEFTFLKGESALYAKRYEESCQYLESSIVYAENVDKAGIELATTLALLAQSSIYAGRIDRADAAYARAIIILREKIGKGSAQEVAYLKAALASDLSRLGAMHLNAGKSDAGKELTESIAIFSSLHAGESRDQLLKSDYAKALVAAMSAATLAQDRDAVRRYYAQMMAPQMTAACSLSDTNTVLRNYASVLRDEGDSRQAADLFAHEKWQSQISKARIAIKSKELTAASKCAEIALHIALESKDPTVSLAESENLMGEILQREGEEQKARNHFVKALAALNDRDSSVTADETLSRLARIDLFEPRVIIVPEMSRLLTLRRKAWGENDMRTAEALVLCACVYDHLHDFSTSHRYAVQALQALRTIQGSESTICTHCETLGTLMLCQGFANDALYLYKKAMDLYDTRHALKPVRESMCLFRLGLAEFSKGEQALAQENLTRAMTLASANSTQSLLIARALAFELTDLREHGKTALAAILTDKISKLASVQPQNPKESEWRRVALLSLGALNTAPRRLDGKIRSSSQPAPTGSKNLDD